MGKIFSPSAFTWTPQATGADKAAFATRFVRFVEQDFDPRLFRRHFFRRLSGMFGLFGSFIPSLDGAYSQFFGDTQHRIDFLRHISNYPCLGNPGHDWSDVERAIRDWVNENGIIARYETPKHGGIAS